MDVQSVAEYIQEIWPKDVLRGAVLFGSRSRGDELPESDWDIGVIHSGRPIVYDYPESWDLFLWTERKWDRGFALQVELAKDGIILFDPDGIIEKKFSMIREFILPHWAGYLQKM